MIESIPNFMIWKNPWIVLASERFLDRSSAGTLIDSRCQACRCIRRRLYAAHTNTHAAQVDSSTVERSLPLLVSETTRTFLLINRLVSSVRRRSERAKATFTCKAQLIDLLISKNHSLGLRKAVHGRESIGGERDRERVRIGSDWWVR